MSTESDLPVEGERLDYLPWSSFDPAAKAPPSFVVAIAILAAVLGGAVVWFFGSRPDPVVEPLLEPMLLPTTLPAPSASPMTLPALSVPPTTLLSEADLVAESPPPMSAVEATAERFVFAYFTSDAERSSGSPSELAASLGPAPSDPTYVEWTSVEGVEADEDGTYSVVVAFRVFVGGDEATRLPVARVEVPVSTTSEGVVVTGWPILLDPPLEQPALTVPAEASIVAGPGGVAVLGQPK